MTDIGEFMNERQFYEFAKKYREGQSVPPFSEQAAGRFYDSGATFRVAAIGAEKDPLGNPVSERDRCLYRDVFCSTFKNVSSGVRSQMLQELFKRIDYSDIQRPENKNFVRVLNNSLRGLEKNEVLAALNSLPLEARLTARRMSVEGGEHEALAQVDLSLKKGEKVSLWGINPEKSDISVEGLGEIMGKHPSVMTFDELQGLMLVSRGRGWDDGTFLAYLKKAQENGSAKDVLAVVKNADHVNSYNENSYNIEIGQVLLTLAKSDKEVGKDLLAEALIKGLQPSDLNPSRYSGQYDDIVKEACDIRDAYRVDQSRKKLEDIIQTGLRDETSSFENKSRISDIDSNLKNIGCGKMDLSGLEHPSGNDICLALMSKMMERKEYAENLEFVGKVLTAVNGMKKPQGAAYERLKGQLNEFIATYRNTPEGRRSDALQAGGTEATHNGVGGVIEEVKARLQKTDSADTSVGTKQPGQVVSGPSIRNNPVFTGGRGGM